MKSKLSIFALIAILGGVTLVPALAQHGRGMRLNGEAPVRGKILNHFAEIDTNSDGAVTREELNAYRVAKLAGLDADADGFLTAEELQAHFMAEAEAQANQRVERIMERSDIDGDGKIGAGEVMLNAHGMGMALGVFQNADSNSDEAVSEDEIKAFIAERHERQGPRGHRRNGGRHGERHGGWGGWGRN